MAAFEDSYKSQLQGVSQQIARERLDGQMSAQDNMLSDVVTNLRRRPGATALYQIVTNTMTQDSIMCWDTDLAGQKVILMLNIISGEVRVLDSKTYTLLSTLQNNYLKASSISNIQVATVGDEFYIANLEQRPALGGGFGYVDPSSRGWFYIKSGAFSKTYEVRVQSVYGAMTASFSTPNGTSAGDAAAASPENIANQLANQINSAEATHHMWCQVDGSYITLYNTWGFPAGVTDYACVVNTTSGSNYCVASGSRYLRDESNLPGRLGNTAHNMIMATGDLKTRKYYRFDYNQLAWLESGDYASPSNITNCPVRITYGVVSGWILNATPFEGRLSGDSDTNPHPEFIARGISGIGAYQGRLVILSGGLVTLSASAKPNRFYRSTVTSVLDSDVIGVGAQAASSAGYKYAIPFQKDLLLFSEKYQAVIPGNNQAITPRTATVVVTSTFEADTSSAPMPIGRTLMYCAPRSADFFGVLEMFPSTMTDSTYTSTDVTNHLPKYMAGRCRFAVSSSVANVVLFAPTNDRNSLIVHEYLWQGDNKVQQAWHRWTFPYPVATAYFSGSRVHVVFVKNNVVVCCAIDPRQGIVTSNAESRPFLDMNVFATVTNNVVSLPTWYTQFDPACLPNLKLAVGTGAMAGEPVGFTLSGSTMTTTRSFANGTVAVGFPYRSTFSPTPPMVKDQNGVKIVSNKFTILRFMLGTTNSAQYMVAVRDSATEDDGTLAQGTLYFSSNELGLGRARVGSDSVAIIPARTDANTTSLVVYTEGTGELNLASLEYTGNYHEKIKRWSNKRVG